MVKVFTKQEKKKSNIQVNGKKAYDMDLEKWYSNQKEFMKDISKKDINVVGEKWFILQEIIMKENGLMRKKMVMELNIGLILIKK